MKAILLGLLLLVTCGAFAQNYQCFQPSTKNFFTNSDGYLRGIRIDSVRTYPGSTIYYPFRTPRGRYSDTTTLSYLPSTAGSWLGMTVIELSDGTTIFDNLWGDSVMLQTRAHVGDSWMFYNDSGAVFYKASVFAMDTMTLFGSPDSVKRIQINAFNSGGTLTSDPLDNLQIVLSKTHGFVHIFDLYTFPYHKQGGTYHGGLDYFMDRPMNPSGGMSSVLDVSKLLFDFVDFINPNDQQLHNWDVGTIIHSDHTCGTVPIYTTGTTEYIADTVVAKSVSGHIATYSVVGVNTTLSYCAAGPLTRPGDYVFADTSFPILRLNRMPEDSYPGNMIFYNDPYSSVCSNNARYYLTPLPNFAGLSWAFWASEYTLGIGQTFASYADGDPEYANSHLLYFKNGSIACGAPLLENTISVMEAISISPNPASNSITISTPGLQPYTISVLDVVGRKLETVNATGSSSTIDVRNLLNGTYLISIEEPSGQRKVKRITVVH